MLFISFWTGVIFQRYQFPPYAALHSAYMHLRYEPQYLMNDVGLKPTRHLVDARAIAAQDQEPGPVQPGAAEVTEPDASPTPLPPLVGKILRFKGADLGVVRILRASGMAPGYRVIFGLTPRTATLFGAMLIDSSGELLHFWPIDYALIDPDGPSPNNVYVHGTWVFTDGDIAVGFDSGRAMARLNPCGEVVWRKDQQHHHTMALTEDGQLVTFRLTPTPHTTEIVFYNAEDGSETRPPIHIINDLFARPEYHGLLALRDTDDNQRGEDPFHLNDVEFLSKELAPAFPMFAAGDMLLSLRELNLLMVLDPRTLALKWWQHGPWHRQHDPDFLPDGRISVFDNSRFSPPSRILTIDPASRRIMTLYSGSQSEPFYSGIRGKHQIIDNGNILITESQTGRAFEVTDKGEIVWEFVSRYDKYNNAVLSEALLLPNNYFVSGLPVCTKKATE